MNLGFNLIIWMSVVYYVLTSCRGTTQYLVIFDILLLIGPHPAVTTKRLWWQ